MLRNFFSALLLSSDVLPLGAVRKVFDEYGVEVRTVRTAEEANLLIRGNRFDLAICDYDVPGASQLACLDSYSQWGGISMVVVRDAGVLENLGKRIHFTVPKPVTADLLARGLKAAYSTMAKRRFATYRHTLALRPLSGTLMHHGTQRSLESAAVVNVSQTGLCLTTPQKLPPGGIVSVSFALPESERQVHIIGTVVWSDLSGKTGVRFHHLPAHEEKLLKERLRARLPHDLDYILGPE
ncbi:MAG: PilZ domain-containing protein [Terriglobales bacterium]